MIAPTTKLCQLAILPLAASLLLFAVPEAWPVVVVLDLLLAVVAIGDATTLPRRSGFEARREFEPIATRGERHRIGLVIENRSRRAHEIDVRDDVGGVIDGGYGAMAGGADAFGQRVLVNAIDGRFAGACGCEEVEFASSQLVSATAQTGREGALRERIEDRARLGGHLLGFGI